MDFVRPSNKHSVAWSTPGMGDHPTGMALYGAIMTALYKRERTGEGSEVSTSLMANGAWANGVFIQAALMDIEFPERPEPLPRHPFYDFYSTKDDREFALGMINSRIEFSRNRLFKIPIILIITIQIFSANSCLKFNSKISYLNRSI